MAVRTFLRIRPNRRSFSRVIKNMQDRRRTVKDESWKIAIAVAHEGIRINKELTALALAKEGIFSQSALGSWVYAGTKGVEITADLAGKMGWVAFPTSLYERHSWKKMMRLSPEETRVGLAKVARAWGGPKGPLVGKLFMKYSALGWKIQTAIWIGSLIVEHLAEQYAVTAKYKKLGIKVYADKIQALPRGGYKVVIINHTKGIKALDEKYHIERQKKELLIEMIRTGMKDLQRKLK